MTRRTANLIAIGAKRLIMIVLLLTLALAACTLTGCSKADNSKNLPEGAVAIDLSDKKIEVDGKKATADASNAVYVANDIVYYKEGKDFTYGEGTEDEAYSKEEAEAKK